MPSIDVMVSTIAIDRFDAVRYCHRCVVDKYRTVTFVIDRDFFAPQPEILEVMAGGDSWDNPLTFGSDPLIIDVMSMI